MGSDCRDHHFGLSVNFDVGADRGDRAGRLRCVAVVAARREAGCLPGGIDASHLHRHRGESGDTEHQNDDQRGDGERRLDGGSTAVTGQTLVFSARLMMLVSAVTIESPVTTV